MSDFISIEEELPDKGEDIIAIDSYGNEHYCYRCKCPNEYCVEWRCSVSGYHLSIDVIRWKYL